MVRGCLCWAATSDASLSGMCVEQINLDTMAAEDRTNRGHMPAYEGVKDTGIHQPAPVPADDEDRLKCLENLGVYVHSLFSAATC